MTTPLEQAQAEYAAFLADPKIGGIGRAQVALSLQNKIRRLGGAVASPSASRTAGQETEGPPAAAPPPYVGPDPGGGGGAVQPESTVSSIPWIPVLLALVGFLLWKQASR